MKGLPWILAGIGVGAAATILLFNGPDGISEPSYAGGYDGVERAARKSFGWGAKNQAKGKVGSAAGAFKQKVGEFTGNDRLADEGATDRVVGNVTDAAGRLGQAVGQTLHDLNR